jgi:hypothetical protein
MKENKEIKKCGVYDHSDGGHDFHCANPIPCHRHTKEEHNPFQLGTSVPKGYKLVNANTIGEEPESWEEELDEKFADKHTLETGEVVTRLNGWILTDHIKDFIRSLTKKEYERGRSERTEELDPYIIHTENCVLNERHAGRPTKDGGYEEKFGDVWYEARPVDRTPKCNCGLSEALEDGKNNIK